MLPMQLQVSLTELPSYFPIVLSQPLQLAFASFIAVTIFCLLPCMQSFSAWESENVNYV